MLSLALSLHARAASPLSHTHAHARTGGAPPPPPPRAVGTPWAVSMAEGRWRLYYSGRSAATGGAWEGLGLALSEELPRFQGAPSAFRRRPPTA